MSNCLYEGKVSGLRSVQRLCERLKESKMTEVRAKAYYM